MSTEQKVKAEERFLIDALRQYRHNDGDGFIFAYDKDSTEHLVAELILSHDMQRFMKTKARNQRDRATRILSELVKATEAVIAISDRKHDAWDAAKAVIKKLGGDRNQSGIGIGLQFLSAKDGKHWPTIGDKYLVRINGVLQNEVFEFEQADSDFGGGDLYWDHNRDTECPLFNSESDEWLPLASLAAYRQQEVTYD